MMQFAPPKVKKETKVQNKAYVYKRLWAYLKQHQKALWVALIFTIIANLLSLVGPYLTGQTIGAMENGVDFKRVTELSILMMIFYSLSALLTYVISIRMIRISKAVTYQMRKDVFNKMNQLPIQFFDANSTGDIISKMTYDIDTINQSLANDVIVFLTSMLTISISFSVMLLTSPALLIVFLVTIPISIVLTTYLSKIVKKKFRVRNQALGELNGYAEEMITGHHTIQSYVLEATMLKTFKEKNRVTSVASYESGYYSTAVMPSVNFINNLSVALVGVFGGVLYFNGMMTLAILTSFTLYSRRFSGPINQLSGLFAEIQSALAASERVFQVLDSENEKQDIENAMPYLEEESNIRFKNVSFEYEVQKPILTNINLDAPSGKVIAIVGPTGSGKTTLINLLMRFYDPKIGGIEFNGKPIMSYQRNTLRKAFSMILQDSWVFHGTIYDNIAYGNGDVSLDQVIEAAKRAHIHEFIMKLNDGYQTVLKHDGDTISKGQKQLIVMARAMLSSSKMLILDEATSNVDTQTEMLIHEAMKDLMHDKTTFVIAHRLSTIQDADLIVVIKNGQMIEAGNHDALISQKGFYATLFNSQFD